MFQDTNVLYLNTIISVLSISSAWKLLICTFQACPRLSQLVCGVESMKL